MRKLAVQAALPQEVPIKLDALCVEWRSSFHKLARKSVDERLAALADFHARFLVIHPFLDGNGPVAKALLMQQCLDLFDRADMSLMDKGAAYYRALAAADLGQVNALKELIRPVIQD